MLTPRDRRVVAIELARRSFWQYCRVIAPLHYVPERWHLNRMCDEMQAFIESPDPVLIINAPPRHYKSYTATNLCQWIVGKMPDKRIMTGSYNETLSQTFSKGVRNIIDTVRMDPSKIVFADVFPNIRIKPGDGAVNRWALQGQHATYLATSPTGTATGFGCDILIIDDLIKNALEANNETTLEKQWTWFTDTMLSRLEEGGKVIIIMTRWHTKDLAGRAEQHFAEIGKPVRKITFQALQADGTMLCPDVLSRETFEMKKRLTSPEIVAANYQQEPIDLKGRLYSGFKTYDRVPADAAGKPLFTSVRAYIDTADQGTDYLCCIVYGEHEHEAYVLDVLYTQQPMEDTEPAVARMLTDRGVGVALIESNAGGRGFARSVERIMQAHKNHYTVVKWFHQSQNKIARILTHATWCMEHIYFPANWRDRWPAFHDSLMNYQQTGKNLHDDAEDALTGVAERMNRARADMGVVELRG